MINKIGVGKKVFAVFVLVFYTLQWTIAPAILRDDLHRPSIVEAIKFLTVVLPTDILVSTWFDFVLLITPIFYKMLVRPGNFLLYRWLIISFIYFSTFICTIVFYQKYVDADINSWETKAIFIGYIDESNLGSFIVSASKSYIDYKFRLSIPHEYSLEKNLNPYPLVWPLRLVIMTIMMVVLILRFYVTNLIGRYKMKRM